MQCEQLGPAVMVVKWWCSALKDKVGMVTVKDSRVEQSVPRNEIDWKLLKFYLISISRIILGQVDKNLA